jgi:hypothetical protein
MNVIKCSRPQFADGVMMMLQVMSFHDANVQAAPDLCSSGYAITATLQPVLHF